MEDLFASKPILKKIIPHLVLAISIFSLVFSSYCPSSSTMVYSNKLHSFIAASLKLMTSHAMNKNYLFLVCNGIFILLAKTSSKFIHESPSRPTGFDLDEMLQQGIAGDGLEITTFERDEKLLPVLEGSGDREDECLYEGCLVKPKESVDDIASTIFIAADDDGDEKEIESFHDKDCVEHEEMHVKDDDDGDGGGGGDGCGDGGGGGGGGEHEDEEVHHDDHMEMLSAEELNKKCEDFIRMMKEEFRISEAAQQQRLVIVK